MAAYRRVYGFGHLRADCRGPGSAPEHYARFDYATTLPVEENMFDKQRRLGGSAPVFKAWPQRLCYSAFV